MKNLYHICTGFFAKTVVMIVLMVVGGANGVWGEVKPLPLPYSWGANDGRSNYSAGLGCTIVGLGTDYASAPKLKFDDQGDYMIIQLADAPDNVSFNLKGNSIDNGFVFKIQESDDGDVFSDAMIINYYTTWNTPFVCQLSASSRYIKFIYDTKSKGNFGLGGISITKYTPNQNCFTVTFDKGDGAFVTPNTISSDNQLTEDLPGSGIVLPACEKDGMNFLGWSTKNDSQTVDVFPDESGKFYPSSDCVLFAVYGDVGVNHSARFFVNGEQFGKTQELHAGDDVVFPNEIPADINGKKFVGWMKGEISKSQDDVPVLLENAKMENSDIEFNAVFAKENSDDGQKIILSDEFGSRSSNDSGAFNSENFTGTNYKAFASQFGGVKLGTADSYGYITSRNLDLSQPFTVSVKVKGWTTVEGTLDVIIDNDKQAMKSYPYSAVSSSQYETAVFEFDAATSNSTIRIATSSKRAYIDDVVVTTAGAVYSGYCTSLLTVKKAVSVVTSENRKIDLSEEDVTGDFVEAVSKDETVKGKNVIVFVGKDIALNEGIENVAVRQSDDSYLCNNLVLTDDGAFSTSKPFLANTATYTRALGADANDYGTICLPYSVTSDSEIQYYKLLSGSTDVLTFAKVDHVDAYTPVLYHRLNKNNIEVRASNVHIAVTGEMEQQGESGKMVGVMKPTSVVDGTNCKEPKDGYAMVVDPDCYYIKGGQFLSLDERVNLKAFRAYISCTQISGTKAAALSLCFEEDMPTDVRIIERKDGLVDMVYDLGGRRGGQNARGVRIVNGRKIVQR